MSTFFERLSQQANPQTEPEVPAQSGGFFQRLSSQPMVQQPAKEEAPWWKYVASPVAEAATGAKEMIVDPLMAAFNPRRTLRADEETGRLVAEHIPEDQFKEGVPQLGEQWQSILENLKEGQDEAGLARSEMAKRMGSWASIMGPAGLALGAGEYALEQGLRNQFGEGASKMAPWLTAAIDIYRSIRKGRMPSKDTIKLMESGLTERGIHSLTPETAAAKATTRAGKVSTREAIKKEAGDIIQKMISEELPLTQTVEHASELRQKGSQLLETAEGLATSPEGRERKMFSDDAGGIMDWLQGKLKEAKQGIVHASENTKEYIHNIQQQISDWKKHAQPKNATESVTKRAMKKNGVNQEMIYKQTKENNKIIGEEYAKSVGSRNNQKINFLTEMNDQLLKMMEDHFPESKQMIDTLKTGNEYYKQGSRALQADNLLKSVLTERGKASNLHTVLGNEKSRNQLVRIFGEKNVRQIEKISADIDKSEKILNSMRTRNKLFDLYDASIAFLSKKYALLHTAVKIPKWLQTRYLLSPKLQKQASLFSQALKHNNPQKALSAIATFQKMAEEEEQRYQEYEKNLIK